MTVGLLAVVTGCGSTATIYQRDGTRTEARIIGSTEDDIYIRTLAGQEKIPRSEVTEINHPGNASGNVGIGLAAFGVLQLVIASAVISQSDEVGTGGAILLTDGILTTVLGAGMTAEGYSRHARSRKAARPRQTRADWTGSEREPQAIANHGLMTLPEKRQTPHRME